MQHVIIMRYPSGDHTAHGPFESKSEADAMAQKVRDLHEGPTLIFVAPLYDQGDDPIDEPE